MGSGVWVYPENGVLGYTLFKIPVEEVFFFFIQTYTTTLAYLLCSKQVVHVAYLNEINADLSAKRVRKQRLIGAAVAAGFLSTIFKAAMMVRDGGPGMYMGMLLVWTVPFLLGLWLVPVASNASSSGADLLEGLSRINTFSLCP